MATAFSRAFRAWCAPAYRSATPGQRCLKPYNARWLVPTLTRHAHTAVEQLAVEVKADTEPKPEEERPRKAQAEKEEEGTPFSELKGKISYDTLKAITVSPMKLTHMTPVQEAVLSLLPGIVEPPKESAEDGEDAPPRDLLVRAKTGTGKTLAFLIPAIEARLKAIHEEGKRAVRDARLINDKNLEARARKIFTKTKVGALILSPTRELATQIANEATKLTTHHADFGIQLLTGGVSKKMQMRSWVKGRLDIVVATTGRLRDLMEAEPEIREGLRGTRMLILDEADTMLDMGFREDIDAIAQQLPPSPKRQTFLFSATVTKSVEQIARRIMQKRHAFINTVPHDDSPVHAHVPQYHTVLPSASEQLPHILRLLAHDQLTNPGRSKVVVFLPTTKMTQLYATLLREIASSVLPAGRLSKIYEIHSRKTMESRTATSSEFRNDKSGACVLVTSDVSARGVDYPGISRVIQVGIPQSTEQYIHRVGRTGRKGGIAGRGDLVLLPWEVGFLTWQLREVPLKPVTSNELKRQVAELAAKFDQDPDAFFKDLPVPARKGIARNRSAPVRFSGPVSRGLDAMDEEIRQLLSQLDEEAIKETMASLLGYYVSKSPELRVQRSVIVEGCKDWTVDACGLERSPYISDAYLRKLGINDGRTKHFGKGRRERQASESKNRWEVRGKVRKSSDREAEDRDNRPRQSEQEEFDPEDPRTDPEEYRTARYGKFPKKSSSAFTEGRRSAFEDESGRFSSRRREQRERDGDRSWDRDEETYERPSRSPIRLQRRSSFGFKR